jgi:hypothetical protein
MREIGMKTKLALTILFLGSPLLSVQVSSEEIRAEQFFKGVTDRVVIQTSPSQVLVFDENLGKTLVLNGHPLVIYADNVKLIGNVTIRAFSENDVPTDSSGVGGGGQRPADAPGCGHNGCPGNVGGTGGDGPMGTPGSSAGDMVLGIKSVSGIGTLTVIAVGQRGGKGGIGGRGGDGSRGGPGEDRGCGNFFGAGAHGPGDGGTGGTGGAGGAGGKGGPGGNGGTITYSDSLLGSIKSGKVILDVSQSSGGGGGPPGAGGGPGSGGDYGPGAACGGGGTNGQGGAGGSAGPPGPVGEKGLAGKTICFGAACPN